MRRRIIGAALGALLALALIPSRSAHADPVTNAQWSRPNAQATVSIGAASNRPGQSAWRAPAVTIYYFAFRTSWVYPGGGGVITLSYSCDPAAPDGSVWTSVNEAQPGLGREPYPGTILLYGSEPISPSQAETLFSNRNIGIRCVTPQVAAATPGPAPTAEEIWESSTFTGEPPTVSVQPEGHGLTGLTAPLWMTSGNATANNTIAVSIRGWTVRANVFIRSVDWRVSDAATDTIVASEGSVGPNADSTQYGSAASPLTTFRFRTKGTYRVTGTIVWGAVGTISNNLGIVRTIDFPDAGLSSSYDYPVDELVGVLNR